MHTATTTTETVNGFTFHLTNHGDHVTTGAETPSREWASIIAQPQQARDGRTVWVAHLWFRGNLECRSGYMFTPAEAAAAAFADLVTHSGLCTWCATASASEVCDTCLDLAEAFAEVAK